MERFRNLAFAFDAVRKGGNMPCILNAANEVVVAAFLRDEIGFLTLSKKQWRKPPSSLFLLTKIMWRRMRRREKLRSNFLIDS